MLQTKVNLQKARDAGYLRKQSLEIQDQKTSFHRIESKRQTWDH
jgi:hypothetical protein